MILKAPCIITARLLPGVRIGNAFISIEPTGVVGEYGKRQWRYYIDIEGCRNSCIGEDLYGHGGAQGMLESLLSFLGACADSYYWAKREAKEQGDVTTESLLAESENGDLFPLYVAAWAYLNNDEISMMQCELEESPGEFIQD